MECDIKRSIMIDLRDYGAEGAVEMRKPSLRRQNEFKNQITRYFVINGDEKTLKPDAPIGDLELLMMLQYVYSAPFATTIEGFLRFTDVMDPDQASALLARMNDCTRELIAYSPFVQSPSQETESLE